MIDPIERAAVHEAGHAIVALSYGFVVKSIRCQDQMPLVQWEPPPDHGSRFFIVLAAGAAAEDICFEGQIDWPGCFSDQQQITQWGGSSLQEYLPPARSILIQHQFKFSELKSLLEQQFDSESFWGPTPTGTQLPPQSNSSTLLTKDELLSLWTKPN